MAGTIVDDAGIPRAGVTVRAGPQLNGPPWYATAAETDADGTLTIYVRERAIDGAANEAVVRLLADHLGVARSRLRLMSGRTARLKRFRID